MDDAEVATGQAAVPNGEAEVPNGQKAAVSGSPAPSKKARTVPLWAALGAALAGVLLAFGAGYAVNAGDADDVRDDLNEKLGRVGDERDSAQASLAVAEGALDECQDAVGGASAMAAAAGDFAAKWQEWQGVLFDFLAAPVGSPEEAQLDLKMVELESQLQSQVGEVTATADRVTADTTACQET